ncbi:hypothetical protein GYMLUDRAFT_54508 [Collybiopsis luxurians FD-317 M1]|nr:hypothetical protein GYMLUDRAFT_54508 [Collybiopsis luxurians FD-317 M1]
MSTKPTAQESSFDMFGQVAVVTGGGTGLGLHMATGLAKNGAKVYITGRRVDVLEKAAKRFSSRDGGGSLVPAGTNVPPSQPDHTTKGFEYFKQGKLPYELETFEGWSSMFRVNTFAPFFVTTAFIDLLIQGASSITGKKTSVVVNISSIASGMKAAYPGNSVSYGFTKRALEQISTFMAADLAQRKIPVRVVALAPGLFPTDFTAGMDVEELQKQPLPGALSPVPLLRWGKPEEISLSANFVVANEYVNGIVLPMDGGVSLVNL